MARLFGILGLALTLAACSSGVSNTGAGAAGTSCGNGNLNMVCTAQLSAPATIAACTAGTEEDGEPEGAAGTDTGTLSVRVSDPLGEYSNTFQGVTLETYDVSYDSGQGGAPNLGTRRFTSTLNMEMTGSVASGSVAVPILDATTKQEFADQASCSTTYPYVVTVRATGTDFATNSRVVIVARTNVGIGGSGAGGEEETTEEETTEEETTGGEATEG